MASHGCSRRSVALLLALGLLTGRPVLAQAPARGETLPPPRRALPDVPTPPLAASILSDQVKPIDLASALRLAGVQNPEILLARERVTEAVAAHRLAVVQILPTLNAGTNFDAHTGPLQQSTGTIINVNRSALYGGMGASAVGAGTVAIPGLVLNGNVSEGIFAALVSKQVVRQREFASVAVRNDVLLRVCLGYLELLRAEGRRAIALDIRKEASEVARVTVAFAATGVGRQADADRAATELEKRNDDLLQAEGDVLTASARLAQVLDLDPSVRLHAIDGWVVPTPLVPDPAPLPALLAIALTQRPELSERQAAIRAAFLTLQGAKLLPFSPTVVLGYSAGEFGGGSNLVAMGIPQADGTVLRQPRFDSFNARTDLDVVVYWSLRNLGVGNVALLRLAQSNLRTSNLQLVEVLDRVRTEVAIAHARTHARFAQIETNERAAQTAAKGYQEDFIRTRNPPWLPIELLDSLRLLAQSRYAYLDAIVDYNEAQFALYVALGQPPAGTLARAIPASLVPVPAAASCPPGPTP
jgi:outer membrane protein TolC